MNNLSCILQNLEEFWSSMLFNFVFYLFFFTFFYSSVTGDSFEDETRVWRKYKFWSQYLWWVYLQPLGRSHYWWRFFIPRGYHQPSSQHSCVEMNCHWYGHSYELTVYEISNFWNINAFLTQEWINLAVFGKMLRKL